MDDTALPQDSAADVAPAETDTPDDPQEIARAQMREALDKKHEKERAGSAHLEGHAKASGTHGKAGGARQFRRKSG